MKRTALLFLLPLLFIPTRANAQYAIPQGTFSNGGAVRSGTHIIYDTAGQTAADKLIGGSYGVNLGFWYLADLTLAVDVAIASFEGQYSNDIVLLKWTVTSDSPFDGYDIYRSEGDGGNFERINEERIKAESTVEYSDHAAIPGRSYSYYISAVKGETEAV